MIRDESLGESASRRVAVSRGGSNLSERRNRDNLKRTTD